MVAAVTHYPPDHIEWHLPLAEAMGYQAIWLEMQGNTTRQRQRATAPLDILI